MNAPPGQPPGGRPPQGPPQGQYRFDPQTGKPIQQAPAQPAQPQYQQPPQPAPAQPAQPQYQQPPQQQAYPQPQQPAPMQPAQPQYQQPQQQAYQPVPQQAYQPGAPAPGYAPAGYPAVPQVKKKDETLALVSILLAAGAWILQFHIFMAVPAVICGHMARKKIKQDPEKFGGDGMAKAGVIIGWINIAIWVLAILAWVLFMVVGCLIAIIGGATS
jgi:hypothetical protein